MLKMKRLVFVLLAALLAIPALGQNPVSAQSASTLLKLANSKELGTFLVDKDGITLYSYTKDPINETVCYDQCAKAWPPLVVEDAKALTLADGIPGTLSLITRKDGGLQVAYNGIALYYWQNDKKAGDTTGHRVGRVWWVVPPATAYAQRIPKLGNVLVGPNGMTLYMFTKDTPNTSTCVDKCAENWPPLVVKSADAIVPGVNTPGKLGTTTRADGTLQVTYNGMPLYFYKSDKALGDSTGENVGQVWFTVIVETVIVGNTKELGDFLVTPDGRTLYTFANDKPDTSTCTGDCLKAWPALTLAQDDRLALAPGLKGKLGTITRDDKSVQVTYNGLPLYLFKDDKVPGDTKGQNVGNVWVVAKP